MGRHVDFGAVGSESVLEALAVKPMEQYIDLDFTMSSCSMDRILGSYSGG